MITGREPNIVTRMEPAAQAKALAKERRAIARNEIAEQKKFYAWLRRERKASRLYFISPRSDKRPTIAIGHPDFSIWLPNGRSLLIEFKAPGAVRTPEQEEVGALLETLGHHVLLITDAIQAQRIVELSISLGPQLYEYPVRTIQNVNQTGGQ